MSEEIKRYLKLVEARGIISAHQGGIELSINDERIDLGKTPEDIADKLKTVADFDLDDLFGSSSMDFASEEGFENDDAAHELFDKAVALMVPKPDETARDKVEEEDDDMDEGCCDDSCPTCGGSEERGPPEAEEQESHKYEKHHSTDTGSVSVEASADSIDELKVLLQKVGITLPSGEPGHDMSHDPEDDAEGPMKVISLSPEPEMDGEKPTMDFPKTEINPDAKEVLTNILKDKLKDYLRNGK